jgi:hypothetical protein
MPGGAEPVKSGAQRTTNVQRVPMETLSKESLQFKILELCPEVQEMGLYCVVMGKGNRY